MFNPSQHKFSENSEKTLDIYPSMPYNRIKERQNGVTTMIRLAIRVGRTTYYFHPQEDSNGIYDCLTEMAGWCHEDAESAACWAEMAYFEEVYESDDPNIEIYFVEV